MKRIIKRGTLISVTIIFTIVSTINSFSQGNSQGFTSPLDTDRQVWLSSNQSRGYIVAENHRGVDIVWSGIAGTSILATKSGTVAEAVTNYGAASWGNYVKINHGGNFYTLYGHMRDAPLVSSGSSVIQGQLLGYVGNTGESHGEHLHYETYIGGAATSYRADPAPYLKDSPRYYTPSSTLIRAVYIANGGSGGALSTFKATNASVSVYFSGSYPTRSGYTCIGWSQTLLSPLSKTASVPSGVYTSANVLPWGSAGVYNVYAVWRSNT